MTRRFARQQEMGIPPGPRRLAYWPGAMELASTVGLRRKWAPLLVAVLINAIVLANTVLHYPIVGYDVDAHLDNVRSYPLAFPAPQDSKEYFSAPLSYFAPSLLDKLCLSSWSAVEDYLGSCRLADAKFAQWINLLLSVGLTITLWKICERLKPGNASLKMSTLALLGILTVYYRTFSQARPEPYVAFFTGLAMLQLLDMLLKRNYAGEAAIRLGLIFGLLILSRQWGFVVFPSLAALVVIMLLSGHRDGKRLVRAGAVASATALLVGGWFYLHLLLSHGSVAHFNRESPGFSFSNQPRVFYLGTGLKDLALFRSPVRPAFDDGKTTSIFIPVFYSDVWGDYWCYFTCVRANEYPVTVNRWQIAPFLGRVNLASLYPTLLFVAAIGYGGLGLVGALKRDRGDPLEHFKAFLVCFIALSLIGYWILQIAFPEGTSMNKATYMIQVFVTLPVLGGLLLDEAREKDRRLYSVLMLGLALVFIHNLPALITRWVPGLPPPID
jgi:hypothetical protein